MIVQTKIVAPPVRERFIRRARLYARLDEIFERRIGLVSAPAGYGKTSLLSAWLRQTQTGVARVEDAGVHVAWLSLEADDDDLIRFLTYLIAALRMSDAAFGKALAAMLAQPQRPPPAALMTSLVNELNGANGTFILVLDDYHVLQAGVVQEAMGLLVDHLPANLHLIISSRGDPPLPLWRLRAAGELLEIRAADLRFTVEEAAEFFDDTMGLPLPADTISLLDRHTEGWVAGLQLAALAGRSPLAAEPEVTSWGGNGSALLAGFERGHAFVFDYLAAEVLDRQPQAIRRFLLRTSVLDRLCRPLCEAILENGARAAGVSQAALQDVVDRGLFLVPLDEEGRWFRYHHLFHGFIRRQLEERHADELPALHTRASAWYEANGYTEQAIRHALAAGDVARAADLAGRAISGFFLHGKVTTIRRYLELLPQEAILERLNFCIGYGWVLAIGGEVQRVEKYLQAGEQHLARFEQEQPPPFDIEVGRSHLSLVRANVALRHGEFAAMAETSRRALATLPESAPPAIRCIAAYSLGQACFATGEVEEAQQALQQAVGHGETAGHRYLTGSALFLLAELRRRQGQLPAAKVIYKRMLQLAEETAGEEEPAMLGAAVLGLATLAHEWNRLEEMGELAARAVSLCEASGEAVSAVHAHLLMARVYRTQGDFERMASSMQEAQAIAHRHQLPVEIARVTAWQARHALYLQNTTTAMALARQAAAELERVNGARFPYSVPEELAGLTVARALLAQGSSGAAEAVQAAQALAIVERWQRFARKRGLTAVVVETSLLQARAHLLLGDAHAARRCLAEALMLAEPGRYTRLFVDEGPAIGGLLREFVQHQAIGAYVRRLLEIIEAEWPGAPDVGHAEPLTPRQREILELVASGLSNHEIAERLVISDETVRWHTKQIYRRLDVRNRTEAAAYAREFKL